MQVEGSVRDGLEVASFGRIVTAAVLAFVGPVAVFAAITLVSGPWEVTGGNIIWPLLVIASFGASGAFIAGTDNLAYGFLAAEMVMLLSFFRDGGFLGVPLALAAGFAGGAIGGQAARPRRLAPQLAGVIVWVAVGGPVVLALGWAFTHPGHASARASTALTQPKPASFPAPGTACPGRETATASPGVVLRLEMQHAGGTTSFPFTLHVSYQKRSERAHVALFVVLEREGGGTFGELVGTGAGVPFNATFNGSWHGALCLGDGTAGPAFDTLPGHYTARAVWQSGQVVAVSAPVPVEIAG